MKRIFTAVLGATLLLSGASYASDMSDYAAAPPKHSAAMTRFADKGTMAKAEPWTVDIVDPAAEAGRHMPAANRDSDPGAVDRELAANPGLSDKLKEMKVDVASVQAITIKDLGTGTRMATVFVR